MNGKESLEKLATTVSSLTPKKTSKKKFITAAALAAFGVTTVGGYLATSDNVEPTEKGSEYTQAMDWSLGDTEMSFDNEYKMSFLNEDPEQFFPSVDRMAEFIDDTENSDPRLFNKNGYNLDDAAQTVEDRINFITGFDVNNNTYTVPSADEVYNELKGLEKFDNNSQREDYMEDLFVEAGYARDEVKRMPIFKGMNNVYVVKKGTSDKTIIVGGHLDKVNVGKGIIDNGSGSTLVTNLAESLKDVETKYSYVFVAFGEEETGLNGAKAYVNQMSDEDKKNVAFMANFDCMGVDGVVIYENISNPGMTETIEEIASQRGVKFSRQKLSPWYGVDSLVFRRAGVPSGSHATHNYEDKIHNDKDRIFNIDKDVYHNTQKMATDLIWVAEQSDL